MAHHLPTIDCKECGHVNEGERVYCHNCGVKLDRSVLLTNQPPGESLESKKKRIKKMLNPDAGLGRGWWKTGIATIVGAAITAAVVDLVLPPRDAPPMPGKEQSLEPVHLDMALENLNLMPNKQRLAFTEPQINDYLKNRTRVKFDSNNFIQNIATFQRVFVNLDEGICRITAQNAIFDWPIYTGLALELKIGGVAKGSETREAVIATPLSGNIGRLWIPGQIARYSSLIFDPIWEALHHEHRLVDEVESIEIHQGQIIFASRGRQPSGFGAPNSPAASRPASTPFPGNPLGNPSLNAPRLRTGGPQ